MSDDQWFRQPCLTGEAKQHFEQRLKRARSARAEYMRIQAHALVQAGAYEEAIALLDRTLTDYPHHMDAWLYEERAECHQRLGHLAQAIGDYGNSMEAMRSGRGAISNAPIRLAELVYNERQTALYAESLGYLNEFWEADPIFPKHELHQFGWAAILMHLLGSDDVEPFARRALEAAAKTRSQAQHHPSLGLAQDADEPLVCRLRVLVEGGVLDGRG